MLWEENCLSLAYRL